MSICVCVCLWCLCVLISANSLCKLNVLLSTFTLPQHLPIYKNRLVFLLFFFCLFHSRDVSVYVYSLRVWVVLLFFHFTIFILFSLSMNKLMCAYNFFWFWLPPQKKLWFAPEFVYGNVVVFQIGWKHNDDDDDDTGCSNFR